MNDEKNNEELNNKGNGEEAGNQFGGEEKKEKPQENRQRSNSKNKSGSADKVSIRSKKMNAHQFAEMIGMNSGSKFWVNKTYKKSEIRTAKKWSDEFILKGAIEKEPEILSKNS